MLVLSRKLNQKIFIGEGDNIIEITVTEISRNNVRLGIKAPRGTPILRGELIEEKKDEPKA